MAAALPCRRHRPPEEALNSLVKDHVLTTKAIVDAKGAMDWAAAAKADREAGQHMQAIGDPLAKAIVGKLPDLFR